MAPGTDLSDVRVLKKGVTYRKAGIGWVAFMLMEDTNRNNTEPQPVYFIHLNQGARFLRYSRIWRQAYGKQLKEKVWLANLNRMSL